MNDLLLNENPYFSFIMRNSKHASKENNQHRFHGKFFENVDYARFRFTTATQRALFFLENFEFSAQTHCTFLHKSAATKCVTLEAMPMREW